MIHIDYSKKLITEDLLDAYQEEFEMFDPTCEKCDKKLELGDYIDSCFPYETEYNICKSCAE